MESSGVSPARKLLHYLSQLWIFYDLYLIVCQFCSINFCDYKIYVSLSNLSY